MQDLSRVTAVNFHECLPAEMRRSCEFCLYWHHCNKCTDWGAYTCDLFFRDNRRTKYIDTLREAMETEGIPVSDIPPDPADSQEKILADAATVDIYAGNAVQQEEQMCLRLISCTDVFAGNVIQQIAANAATKKDAEKIERAMRGTCRKYKADRKQLEASARQSKKEAAAEARTYDDSDDLASVEMSASHSFHWRPDGITERRVGCKAETPCPTTSSFSSGRTAALTRSMPTTGLTAFEDTYDFTLSTKKGVKSYRDRTLDELKHKFRFKLCGRNSAVDDLGSIVDAYCEAQDVPVRDFAEICGFSEQGQRFPPAYALKFLNGNQFRHCRATPSDGDNGNRPGRSEIANAGTLCLHHGQEQGHPLCLRDDRRVRCMPSSPRLG